MDVTDTTTQGDVNNEAAGSVAVATDSKPAIHDIPIEKIQVNEFWSRNDWQEDLDSLATSIETDGLLQFPAVRDRGDGTFVVVFGHRRYLACKRSGRKTIPCYVIDVTAENAAFLMLTENFQRRQLHPVEEARTIRRIADEFKLKDVEVALRIGWKANVVNERLAVLRLPEEMQKTIGIDPESCFKLTHAVTLARLWDDKRSDRQFQVRKLYEKTIRHKLSTTELKELVAFFKDGEFDRLPDRLRVALLSSKWMTAAMAGLYRSPHQVVLGKDPRARAMAAAARNLNRDELEDLIAGAVEAEWTYEKISQKLLKTLEKRLDAATPKDPDHQSGVDRLLSCVSLLDQQLAANRDEIEELARSNPKELGAIWFAIVQLHKRLQPVATLVSKSVNGLNLEKSLLPKEAANVDAG